MRKLLLLLGLALAGCQGVPAPPEPSFIAVAMPEWTDTRERVEFQNDGPHIAVLVAEIPIVGPIQFKPGETIRVLRRESPSRYETSVGATP